MDSDAIIVIALKLLLVLFLVVLNGFFVAAEFAIVKIRDTQLIGLVAAGNRRAKMARLLISHLDASLSATQLGITLASLGLGWVGEPVFSALLEPILNSAGFGGKEFETLRHTISVIVGFSAITFLHIVAGELAPKSLAIQKPLPTTIWVAYPLRWFYVISYPFNWALNGTSLWLLRRLGLEAVSEGEMVHSEEELRLLFATTQKRSGGTSLGRAIVLNALDLRRRVVREVMRPRQEIVALSTEASMTECLDVAEKTRFSRFPLCEDGDLDRTLGVIHFKDLYAMRLKAKSGAELRQAARKIVYVPETARLEKLLQVFLDRKLHLAIVVDEHGGTVGLVTLENILEELVGQIQDEFDQEKPMAVSVGDHSWDIAGALPVHDLEQIIGVALAEDEATTVSGWVTRRTGGFPKPGDVLTVGDYEVRVEEINDTRVARLRVTRTWTKDARLGGETS
jgi:CBS domain containing-hemolysin-like protein